MRYLNDRLELSHYEAMSLLTDERQQAPGVFSAEDRIALFGLIDAVYRADFVIDPHLIVYTYWLSSATWQANLGGGVWADVIYDPRPVPMLAIVRVDEPELYPECEQRGAAEAMR